MKTRSLFSMLHIVSLAILSFQGVMAGDHDHVDLFSFESWIQQQKLVASDGSENDLFAVSVALDGDTALVGADFANIAGNSNQGAVYVFTRDGGVWAEQSKLTAADGAGGDHFGYSVALDGDTALVGGFGAAYIFIREDQTWTQQAKLIPADGMGGEQFGYSVALSGNNALVGALTANIGEEINQGAAYVYTRSSGLWTEQAKLVAMDGTSSALFGNSVALEGDLALVGARQASINGNLSQGAGYIFTRVGSTWTEQARLLGSDGTMGMEFGSSVALHGSTALVGAWQDGLGANHDRGAAYVFTFVGSQWSEQAKLTASDGSAQDMFGVSVALDGNTAIVGAWQADVGANSFQGAAYIFTRQDNVWTEQTRLVSDDGAAFDRFGVSVAIDGNTGLIGAFAAAPGGNVEQGAVYAFVLDGDDQPGDNNEHPDQNEHVMHSIPIPILSPAGLIFLVLWILLLARAAFTLRRVSGPG